MRIWTIHPDCLDKLGLVALWREGLLALNVLKGNTRGYKKHPQLIRFKKTENPVKSITNYLHIVWHTASSRGYKFDISKLSTQTYQKNILTSQGQLNYEIQHLSKKIQARSPNDLYRLNIIKIHPIFDIDIDNLKIETWEKF